MTKSARRALVAVVVLAVVVFAITQGMFRTWDVMDYLGWGALVVVLALVALAFTVGIRWLRRDLARDRS